MATLQRTGPATSQIPSFPRRRESRRNIDDRKARDAIADVARRYGDAVHTAHRFWIPAFTGMTDGRLSQKGAIRDPSRIAGGRTRAMCLLVGSMHRVPWNYPRMRSKQCFRILMLASGDIGSPQTSSVALPTHPVGSRSSISRTCSLWRLRTSMALSRKRLGSSDGAPYISARPISTTYSTSAKNSCRSPGGTEASTSSGT